MEVFLIQFLLIRKKSKPQTQDMFKYVWAGEKSLKEQLIIWKRANASIKPSLTIVYF